MSYLAEDHDLPFGSIALGRFAYAFLDVQHHGASKIDDLESSFARLYISARRLPMGPYQKYFRGCAGVIPVFA